MKDRERAVGQEMDIQFYGMTPGRSPFESREGILGRPSAQIMKAAMGNRSLGKPVHGGL